MIDSLVCWIRWTTVTLYSYGVDAFEFILDAFAGVANLILGLLPSFALSEPQLDSGVVGLLNYIVPVGSILSAFGVLMGCWILYRIYQWALKWVKATG